MSSPNTVLPVGQPSSEQDLLTAVLASNYHIEVASSGAEGLLKAASHLPDMIALDHDLADIDGYELCQRLRAFSVFPLTTTLALSITW